MENAAPDIRFDYFTLLALPPSFTLDAKALDAAYFALQREVHPDRLAKKSEAERQKALLLSMDVNEAYRALKTPLGRAKHLLAREGVLVCTDHDTVKPDTALLAEVMEWREALDEAADENARAALLVKLNDLEAQSMALLTDAFAQKRMPQAAQLTLYLHYLEKTRQDLLLAGMKQATS